MENADKSFLDIFIKFKSIIITMAVVVAVSGAISYGLDKSAGPSESSPWYSVLPETAHNLNSSDATPLEPEKISSDIVLTGTIIDPAGNNTAIMEAGGSSYVANLGSAVGDMKVVEISGTSLTLAGDQGARQLEMQGGGKNNVNAEGSGLSINFNKTNFRDAVSALALMSSCTVLMDDKDASARIDYHNNADPLKSLESIAQKQGLVMSRQGNTVVVAKADSLPGNFFDQVIKFKCDLKYMNAQDLYTLIDNNKKALGINPDVPTNPHQIRFVGKVQVVDKVREMIALCDVPDGAALQSKTLIVKNIAPDKGVEMLAKAGIPLAKYVTIGNSILVFDSTYFNKWKDVENLLSQFDSPSAANNTIVVVRLKYITADLATTSLAQFNIGNGAVKPITYAESASRKDLMLQCPQELESQVKAALNTIDTSREAVKLPVLTATGSDGTNECRTKMRQISSMTGIAEDRMYISSDLAGGSSANNRLYVLWINDRPENIKKVQDIIAQI
ncbi:MAG: hypothetical protein ACM3PP_13205 [Candidatus Saccharibacteria bacterium]